MAIISFSPSPSKGTSSTATLNKSELYALSPISGDAFWSNASNVKEVTAVYESSIGGQTKVLSFDATAASPEAVVAFSSSARDAFELKHIVLKDNDDGEIRFNRSELTALGVSLDISLPPSAGALIYNSFGDAETGFGYWAFSGGLGMWEDGVYPTASYTVTSYAALQPFTMTGNTLKTVALSVWKGDADHLVEYAAQLSKIQLSLDIFELDAGGNNLVNPGSPVGSSEIRTLADITGVGGVALPVKPGSDSSGEAEWAFTTPLSLSPGAKYAIAPKIKKLDAASFNARLRMFVSQRHEDAGAGIIKSGGNFLQNGTFSANGPSYRMKIYTI